jgi:hypothetical protein
MRYLWALVPNTILGLLIVACGIAHGGRARWVDGVLEAHGGLATWLLRRVGASAMTLGHVVIGIDPWCLDQSRDHERVHVRQYERWGPLFLPLYGWSSLWAWLRGRHPYFDNAFERQAFDET